MKRRLFDATLAADLWFFRAAAEVSSFKDAAGMLHVTQSAVSQRIARLESRLDLVLFERVGRSVFLTAEGKALYESTSRGFDIMSHGISLLETIGRERRVKVSCIPSLALEWLTPRIYRFQSENPGIVLEVYGEMHNLDMSASRDEQVDVVIRYGKRFDTNLRLAIEHEETLFPVAAPSVAHSLTDRASPRDNVVLLHDASAWIGAKQTSEWDLWLEKYNPPWAEGAQHVFSNLAQLSYRMASEGTGVAMGRGLIVARHIKEGRLARIGDEKVHLPYFVFTPYEPGHRSAVDHFLQWLHREMKEA